MNEEFIIKRRAIIEEITKGEKLLSYLSHKYQMSEVNIMGIVRSLKTNDMTVITSKLKDDILIRNFGHKKLENNSAYNIVINKENIKILLIADTRYGSKFAQPSIVNKVYEEAFNEGVDMAFLVGDITEGSYGGAKAIHNDTLYRTGACNQSDLVADTFPDIGVNTYFIEGEHDLTHLSNKDEPYSVGKLISEKREDLIHLGAIRRLIQFSNDDNENLINMLIHHPTKPFKPPYTLSYRPQQSVKAMRSEDKPDIYVSAHQLVSSYFPYRGISVIQVPSLCATTPEMEESEFHNTIGAWIIDIKKDEDHTIDNIVYTSIPGYKSLDKDVEKAKVLRLNNGVKNGQ